MTPQELRAEVAATKRAVAPDSGWRIREAMFPDSCPDGVWFAAQHVMTEVFWGGDDPNFQFLTADDCPGLSAEEVEHLNAPHRATYRTRCAVATYYDGNYHDGIWSREFRAWMRRPIAKARVEQPDEAFVGERGGWLPTLAAVPELPHPFWNLVIDAILTRQQARADQDWPLSDAIRSELTAGGIELIDHKAGTEWLSTAYPVPVRNLS